MDIRPTGKQVMVPAIVMRRIAEGNIVEDGAEYDLLGMMQQPGVIHPMGEAGG